MSRERIVPRMRMRKMRRVCIKEVIIMSKNELYKSAPIYRLKNGQRVQMVQQLSRSLREEQKRWGSQGLLTAKESRDFWQAQDRRRT